MSIEHTSVNVILFFVLYGGAAAVAIVFCLYLLFRRGNAIAPDITPPILLRRWAAAFFAIAALGHLWWLIFLILSGDNHSAGFIICAVLDCVSLLTTISGTLLAMLQDRRRRQWPFIAAMTPIVILGGLQIAWPDINFMTPIAVYFLLLYVLFTVYMIHAVRQYGRWLHDNYADLEHKEVWMSLTLLTMILLVLIIYGYMPDDTSFFLIRILNFVLFGFLLWRVETLPQLEVVPMGQENGTTQKSQAIPSNIEQMLASHCVDTKLYLQHDLTLQQLAQTVGTNRLYLSRYFSRQGITYNTYINDLRINHFISRYLEAVAAGQPVVAQQLASDSGYRSYSTFSLAFKQRTGQSVTVWMREMTMKISPRR